MPNPARHFLLSVLAGTLTACASYAPQPVDPAAQQARLVHRTLSDPELQRWLDSRQIPSDWGLDRLTWTAVHNNAELATAKAHWRSAQAAAITAGAYPNPQLDASLEHVPASADSGVSFTRGLSLGIPIVTAGKRSARVAIAVADAEQARLDYADVLWKQRQQVRSTLVDLLVPAEPLQALADAQTERARLMQKRMALGLSGHPDLTQARLTAETAAADAADARKARAESRATLAGILNVPVESLAGVQISLKDVSTPIPAAQLPMLDLQRQALLKRPDVLAALAGYQSAEASLRLEVAKQYPDLTLSPGLLWEAGQMKWSLGLSLLPPLLDRNRGPIAEAKAHREEAAANVMKVQAAAIADLDHARAGYLVALESLAAATARVGNAQRLVVSAQRALSAGTGIRSEVLGAEVEFDRAAADRQRALMQAEKALGDLEDATRTPLAGNPFPVLQIANETADGSKQ